VQEFADTAQVECAQSAERYAGGGGLVDGGEGNDLKGAWGFLEDHRTGHEYGRPGAPKSISMMSPACIGVLGDRSRTASQDRCFLGSEWLTCQFLSTPVGRFHRLRAKVSRGGWRGR
jgi:hypothetical protein